MSRRGPTSYFVVFAPGHYGNECKVLSSHHTYNAALRAIADTTTLCVRQGHLRKGDTFLRIYEETYQYASK